MAETFGQGDFELWPSLLDAKHEVRKRGGPPRPPLPHPPDPLHVRALSAAADGAACAPGASFRCWTCRCARSSSSTTRTTRAGSSLCRAGCGARPPPPTPLPPDPARSTRRTPSCCPLVGLTTRSWFRAPRSAGGRQNGLREMHDLPEGGQLQLMREISQCSRALQDLFKPTKMNVAAIGNMCNQLHIHVTCRIEGDPSWPGPCYGLPRTEYSPEALAEALSRLRAALA